MDYISREDAIKDIQHYGVGSQDFENYTPEQAERFVITRLNNLPAADVVERKKGKWILHHDSMGNVYWTCSECGFKGNCNYTITNFCSNCGADMREE